ncbi:MAG: GDSL-type esterase/lipase family protein [Thermodesulfobacteriota bacterium]
MRRRRARYILAWPLAAWLVLLSGPASAQAGDQIVFLGDSLTAAGRWSEMFGDERLINQGVVGDTTALILKRLDSVLVSRPAKLFLMAGINDLGAGVTVRVVATRYANIVRRVNRLSPETTIFVQSVLPVNKGLYPGSISNQDIKELNGKIKALAERYGAIYVDLFSLVAGRDGQLRPEFTSDGVHLKREAYLIWKSAIEEQVR